MHYLCIYSPTNVHRSLYLAQGELEIRSPAMFREYWKAPKKTAEEFTGEVLYRFGLCEGCLTNMSVKWR